MLNTEDLHAVIVNEGSDIPFTEEVSQNQIRLRFVPLHCSTSETILYYCFARSSVCHSVRFLVSALSWFKPWVCAFGLTGSSIQPIVVNGTDGLYNPRIQKQYYFTLSFEACNNIVDPSVRVELVYTADQTYRFTLVRVEIDW